MKIICRIIIWLNWQWSRLYRCLLEPKGKLPIRAYSSMAKLTAKLRDAKWVADGPRQLWDATGSPEHFEYLLTHNMTPKSGQDCDEFAVYAYTTLRRYPLPLAEQVEALGILTVVYWKPWFWRFKTFGGHHVCLLRCKGQLVHVGNWGFCGNYADLQQAVKSVLRGRPLLTWYFWQPGKMIQRDMFMPRMGEQPK